MQEVYVRGSTIKYLRIPDDVVELVKEEVSNVLYFLLFWKLLLYFFFRVSSSNHSTLSNRELNFKGFLFVLLW